MKRWLGMAALSAILLSTPVWGQRGGRGGMSTGGAGHGGFVGHGGGGFSQGPMHAGSSGHGGFTTNSGWRHSPYGYPYRYPFYSARYPYRWGSPWAYGSYGYGYGSYGYPGWGWSVGFDDSSSYPSQQYPAAAYAYPDYSGAYAQNSQIQQDEIDRLSREVDRLQEDRASRQPEAPPKSQVHADTVLVFRDKHTEEIQNYALVGNTLWVFTELRARKIPVSNLDVPATTRANEDRGIEFNLPK